MPQLGPAEILVVLVVALLVFGPKRLPEVGRQVGRGLRELRKIQDTVRDEINDVLHHDEHDEAPAYTPVSVPPPTPAAATGHHAPSRYRIAAPAAAALPEPPAPQWPPASADTGSSPARSAPASGGGAHAPSRFRAPDR